MSGPSEGYEERKRDDLLAAVASFLPDIVRDHFRDQSLDWVGFTQGEAEAILAVLRVTATTPGLDSNVKKAIRAVEDMLDCRINRRDPEVP
jgi:hypothetical protein